MRRSSLQALMAVLILIPLLFLGQGPAVANESGYEDYIMGDPADVSPRTSFGLVLMGGSTDVDDAFRWMIQRSGGGDFVILRASGTDAYNPWIYTDLGGVNSVETIITTKQQAAYDPYVLQQVRNAEALWISGGNQWDYVRMWKGTPLEDAIMSVAAKGAPVGGTSAGLAVLGEFVFSAEKGTIVSDLALKNPYQSKVAVARDFLSMPYMTDIITDSHFAARDRMGRLLTFMARIVQDGWAFPVKGMGVDEKTALAVDERGMGTLYGSGSIYFLNSTSRPEVCRPEEPLTFRNVSVYKLTGQGSTFDLVNWKGKGGTTYSLSVVNGIIESTQVGGSIY